MHAYRPPIHTQISTPPPPPPSSSRTGPFSHYGPPPVPFPHTAPSKPPTVTASPQKLKSNTPAPMPVIRAEPQVRNLQKELTTLVPASVLRNKASASKQKANRHVVNAAPKIDDEDGSENAVPLKRSAAVAEIPVLSGKEDDKKLANAVLTAGGSVGSTAVSTGPTSAKKTKIRKKVDEYEKFMSEMADLL
jgi:hypothetical protein